MIVNGKKYDNLKDSLEDVKVQYPFMTLERLKNIQAGRHDRLSNVITIEKIKPEKKDKLKNLLRVLKERHFETYLIVNNVLNSLN